MEISLLEGRDEPWIPGAHTLEDMAGELSAGEEGVERGGWGWQKPSLTGKYFGTMWYF